MPDERIRGAAHDAQLPTDRSRPATPPFEVRRVKRHELDPWLDMRERLWPSFSRVDWPDDERDTIADSERGCTLVAAAADGRLLGFLEVAERAFAEGCETGPVGYVEGWWVEPPYRKCGVGRALMRAAEEWATQRGYREIASDTETENIASQNAHAALGFEEVERIVLFRKSL